MKLLFFHHLIIWSVCENFIFASTINTTADPVAPPDDEDILNWHAPSYLLERYPFFLLGYDYDSAPVLFTEFGKWDLKRTLEEGEKEALELEDYIYRAMLVAIELGKINGNAHHGTITIVDMDGFSLSHTHHARSFRLVTDLIRTTGETLGEAHIQKFHLINVNFLAKTVWKLAGSIWGKFANKFELYGSNPNVWRPQLLRHIPPDQLPEYLGGFANHTVVRVLMA